MKDSDGKIVMEKDRLMEVWRAHYEQPYNEDLIDRKYKQWEPCL